MFGDIGGVRGPELCESHLLRGEKIVPFPSPMGGRGLGWSNALYVPLTVPICPWDAKEG